MQMPRYSNCVCPTYSPVTPLPFVKCTTVSIILKYNSLFAIICLVLKLFWRCAVANRKKDLLSFTYLLYFSKALPKAFYAWEALPYFL